MHWRLSWRADPRALPLADRHYNRQTPGAPQFVPPGRCLVLLAGPTEAPTALWVTSWPLAEYTLHAWAGAWVCSLFRREADPDLPRASDLIREAVAATRWRYGEPPALGMVTFVDRDATRSKRDPGYCYFCAGWAPCGRTKERGLHALRLAPEDMPPPEQPLGATGSLW